MESKLFFGGALNRDLERRLDNVRSCYEQVLQEKGVLRFCPTPYCTMGYTVGEGNGDPFRCPSCYNRICTRCVLPYHEGKTCEFYQNSQTGQEFSANEDLNMSKNKSKQRHEHIAVLYHANKFIRDRSAEKILREKDSAKRQELEDTNSAKRQKLEDTNSAKKQKLEDTNSAKKQKLENKDPTLIQFMELPADYQDLNEFSGEDSCEMSDEEFFELHRVFNSSKVTRNGIKFDVLGGKPRKYFCPTPDCDMQYEFGEGCDDTFCCSSCHKIICTKCHVVYHDGMTCEVYQNSPENEDRSLKVWLSADPKNRIVCSTCSSPIEKKEGCNRVVCMLCESDICFQCGMTFLTPDGFGDHYSNCRV